MDVKRDVAPIVAKNKSKSAMDDAYAVLQENTGQTSLKVTQPFGNGICTACMAYQLPLSFACFAGCHDFGFAGPACGCIMK